MFVSLIPYQFFCPHSLQFVLIILVVCLCMCTCAQVPMKAGGIRYPRAGVNGGFLSDLHPRASVKAHPKSKVREVSTSPK